MPEKTIFQALAENLRDVLTNPPEYLPAPPAADPAQVANALQALDQASQQLDAAPDLAGWRNAARTFRDALRNLAHTALGGTPQQARDNLFARFLLAKFPRTAATLVVLGIIWPETDTSAQPPVTRYRVDWQRLDQFVRGPETLANEQTWEDLFADVGSPHSGRLLAVLAGLLIMAPRTLIALIQGDLKVAPLSPPPVRSAPGGGWARFRQLAAEWISFTLPAGDPLKAVDDPADPRFPANKFDLQADMEPDLSTGLHLRSKRHPLPGGSTGTDFELWLAFGIDRDKWEWQPWETWFLTVEPGLTAGFGKDGTTGEWHGAFAPLNANSPLLPSRPDDPLTIHFDRVVPGGAPDIALGPPYDTRLVIRDLGAWIKVRQVEPAFEIGARIKGLEAVLATRWFRTFGQTNESLREGIRMGLDLDFAYGVGRGVSLNLQSGLELLWVINKQFGGDKLNVKLHSIRFIGELLATAQDIQGRVNIRLHISGQLGPVGLVIDGPGAWFGWWPNENNEMEWWGLLPPTGAGISLELGPIMVGGFLDFRGGPTEKYAGLLAAKLWALEIIAFGIHEKLPSGRTSLIVVLGARFTPGIQLGFGFAITGVGGIVGVNRRADTDHLRERLTSGATGNILFAPDPVKSAPVILGDLDYIFPAADNIHVGGPTLQISWIAIARFDIAIVVEIATGTNQYNTSGLTKIVLLGTARIRVGTETLNTVNIRMDVVGVIDFVKEVIEFDATLFDSRVMTVFVLVGDAAFRLSWGDRPYALLTLGGFHPSFNPEPAVFPELARLGLAYDQPTGGLKLRLEFYLAVTTNTVQLGGKIEVTIKAGSFNIVGWLAADALIQFEPFLFTLGVNAGVRVRYKKVTLCGVKFSGTLSGPSPLKLSGEVCIEILFFDICWSDSFTIGDGAAAVVAAISSLLQVLAPELSNPKNLVGVDSDDRLVTARPQQTQNNKTVLSPIGRLQWAQKRAPLDTLIERFEAAPLASPQAVVVSSLSASGEKAQEWFSPGTFTNLSESEQLNRAPFERLPSGLVLGFDRRSAAPVAENIEFVNYVLPREPVLMTLLASFPSLVLEGAYGRSAAAGQFQRSGAAIKVKDEGWTLHAAGGAQSAGLSQTDAHQRARYQGATALPDNDVIDLGGI